MIFRSLTVAAALLAAGIFAVPAGFASAMTDVDRPQVLAEDAPKILQGTVVSLDAEKSTFVLKIGEGETTLKYTERTIFMKGGERVAAEEVLKADASVRVAHKDDTALSVAGD